MGPHAPTRYIPSTRREYQRELYWIARFNSGTNAGHTLKFDGKTFVTHILPSGACYPRHLLVLGPGMVLDPEHLLQEIKKTRLAGFLENGKIFIDLAANVILPEHEAGYLTTWY